MKLLKKSEVATQSAELRRQQISEGQELVKRINALREAHTSLTEQHKNFVEKSKEELRRETSELYGQRESLKAEVESLTVIREELKKPLDHEWNRVQQEIVKLNTEKQLLSAERLELNEIKESVESDRAKVDILVNNAKDLEKQAKKRDEQSRMNNEESQKILKSAKNKAQKIDKEIEARLQECKRIEDAVNFEKKGVEQLKKIYELREISLADREKAVKDKEETLLRTQQRIKKQK